MTDLWNWSWGKLITSIQHICRQTRDLINVCGSLRYMCWHSVCVICKTIFSNNWIGIVLGLKNLKILLDIQRGYSHICMAPILSSIKETQCQVRYKNVFKLGSNLYRQTRYSNMWISRIVMKLEFFNFPRTGFDPSHVQCLQ